MPRMKTFIPKLAGMSKADIYAFLFEEDDKMHFCMGDGKFYSKPLYTAKQIPDGLAQRFVDDNYTLYDQYGHEEDRVDARNELVSKLHKDILKAIK